MIDNSLSLRRLSAGDVYMPLRLSLGAELVVTPPYRNTWDSEEQAACTITSGINAAYDKASGLGYPGTRRYARLTGDQALRNNVAYAAFAFEIATGVTSSLRARPSWS